MKSLLLCSILLILSSCASSKEAEDEDPSDAHYAAYAAEGFTFYTPEPVHDGETPEFFYHKHCSLTGEVGFQTPNDYGCDDLNR